MQKTYKAVDDLIQQIQAMDYPQQLDPDYDGSCPCFAVNLEVVGHIVVIEGSCWRVSMSCDKQDLRLNSSLPRDELLRVGAALKQKLDAQEWYSPYRIILPGCAEYAQSTP